MQRLKKCNLRSKLSIWGYREKYTRERHARGVLKGGSGPSRPRRSLTLSCAARFSRPNMRACSKASVAVVKTRFSVLTASPLICAVEMPPDTQVKKVQLFSRLLLYSEI